MKKLLWIGLAGSVGAIARVLLGQVIPSESGYPASTLLVNLVGTFLLCFIVIGALPKLDAHKQLKEAITTGFLGSFTTFSAFSMETVQLLENGQIVLALLYVVSSMIGGLAAGILGFHFGRKKVRE